MWLTSLIGGSGPARNTVQFEVQSYKVDHWVTEAICDSEEQARTLVNRLLIHRDGMRIIRDFSGDAGPDASLETVIYSEMRGGGRTSVTIPAIEQAPQLCTTSVDLLGLESRQTMSRLLRQYLDRRSLTTSELLYNAKEMARAMDYENMVPNAVTRVSSLQAQKLGRETRERRDFLFDTLAQLKRQALQAAKRNLPTARQHGFLAAMTQVGQAAAGQPDMQDYLAKVVLCQDTVQIRNLLGKIEWLLALMEEGKAEDWHHTVLDGLIADAVSSPAIVQDMLGRQPDLGTALNRLLDVIEGRFEAEAREQAPDLTAALSRWLGAGGGAQTRQVLLDNLIRSLRGTQRFSYGEPSTQMDMFAALAGRLLTPSGFTGGPVTAEALTLGYLRFIEQGGAGGRRLCVEGMMALLANGKERLHYLIALSQTDTGAKDLPFLQLRTQMLLENTNGLDGLLDRGVPLKPKMQSMAMLYTAMAGAGFPDEVRDQFAERIDTLVADYIVQAKVIEKLDDPAANLRTRATRLVQFAAADILASPKARRIVRDQIIRHLRRPNFDAHFIEGIQDPAEQARTLRNFHDLLRAAQFM